MDQVLAFRWIKDHISNFGGDPAQVTLFGQDAGAVSISNHLISPLTQQLFNRAIVQSGTSLCPWSVEAPHRASSRYQQLAQMVDCERADTDDVIRCLREVDAAVLADKLWDTDDHCIITAAMATIDGTYFVKHPFESVKSGEFKNTDVLLGSVKDEGSPFYIYQAPELLDQPAEAVVTDAKYDAILKSISPADSELLLNSIKFEYEVHHHYGRPITRKDTLDDVIGDVKFICPTNDFAVSYASQGNTVYMYHYLHVSSQNPWPVWLGAMHGYEIDSVFGVPLIEGDAFNYTEAEVTFSQRMMTYWKNFATTG